MSNRIGKNRKDDGKRSRWSSVSRALGNSRKGQHNFTNLSIYAFGLSGVWTGVGAGILPFKVLEALEAGRVEMLGYSLDKNGALGMLSLVGLAVAAAVQLGAGELWLDLSDGGQDRRVVQRGAGLGQHLEHQHFMGMAVTDEGFPIGVLQDRYGVLFSTHARGV